jgi:hypothetical protein
MNPKFLMRIVLTIALLSAIGGCASLSKSECMNANWEDIGIRDGANGQPEEYLIRHSTACAKVGVAPDRGAWLHGREKGLERFCVPHRAYQIGESGGGFDSGICRGFDEGRLQDAYQKGREINRLAGVLNSISTEIRDIHVRLERKDLEQEERERLAYRLGSLEAQRNIAQRDYDAARYRARDL